METLCQLLFCGLELFRLWVNWFCQIMDCCIELFRPDGYLWELIKHFTFPETGLMSPSIAARMRFQRLQTDDIYSLFMAIINDSVPKARQYIKEWDKSFKLLQILFSLLGIMFLGISFFFSVYIYYTRKRLDEEIDHMHEIFKAEKRMQAAAKRSLLMAREELRHLKVNNLVQCEELQTYDGTSKLLLKVASKLQLLDNITSNKMQTTGRLYRLQDQQLKFKHVFKTQVTNIALRFLGKYPRKLHLLVVFEKRVCANKSTPTSSQQKQNRNNSLTITRTYKIFEFFPRTGSSAV